MKATSFRLASTKENDATPQIKIKAGGHFETTAMAIQWGAATHTVAPPLAVLTTRTAMSNIDNLSIQLYTLGRELGEIAQRTRDQGITLGYHNHHWELAPKDGAKTARASYAFISHMGV
jgi:hypothetical protein